MSVVPLERDIVVEAVDRWAGVLASWLRPRSDSPEDIVQEAFCRLACLDKPPERIAPWLFQVSMNLCYENARKTQRRLRREQGRARSEVVHCHAHEAIVHREVREAVESLPSSLRDLVIARLWAGLTLQESAELLNISTTTAHRRYQESISRLRTLLTEKDRIPKTN